MKILYITNNLRGKDGWSKYSKDLVKEAKNSGCDVLCLTNKRSDLENAKEIVLLKNPLKYLANPIRCFLDSLKISKIIKNFSPDIIHFIVEPYITILPFLNCKKVKTVLTVHGTYSVMPSLLKNFFKKRISFWISKKYYKKLDIIISISNFTKFNLVKYYPELNNKIKIISNGINLEKNKIIRFKNTNNKIKQILFVGAIKSRKGIMEAIEILKYYDDNISNNFIYNIIGSYDTCDNYYKQIVKKIKEYNMEKKIIFKRKVSDKERNEYYKNSDLFLMLPINDGKFFEGFGLVYLEANAFGLPCIGSYDSGSSEAILNNKTGYIVDPRNKKDVAYKIDLILNQNKIYSENCVKWAKENDIKNKVGEIINLYKQNDVY